MRMIYLDGRLLQRNEEGHLYIQEMFEFPEYYGKNLDGMYDLLTEVGSDLEIHIHHSDAMDHRIKKVFLHAEIENEHLKIFLTNEISLG